MTARRLVIDCATPALSVALFEGETCLDAAHHELGRGHAESLLPAIAALPDGGRADSLYVDIGPGSFTGVRVGIAAARALAMAWRIPAFGYGCLDMVAAMIRTRHAPAQTFPVVMIGGHGELFWAIYAADEAASPEPAHIQSTPIAALAQQIDHDVIYGSGAQILLAARNRGGEAISILPDARCLPLLSSALSTLPVQANYGRGADAKPMTPRPPAAPVQPAS